MNLRVLNRALGFSLVFALVGCGAGASSCTLKGKITSKGQPVFMGTVSVKGSNGEEAYGGIFPDGTYLVPNCPVGHVKVAVSSPKPPPTFAPQKRVPGAAEPPPPPDTSKWVAIDAKFEQYDTSG